MTVQHRIIYAQKKRPTAFHNLEVNDKFVSKTYTDTENWKLGNYVKVSDEEAKDTDTGELVVFQGWRLCYKIK